MLNRNNQFQNFTYSYYFFIWIEELKLLFTVSAHTELYPLCQTPTGRGGRTARIRSVREMRELDVR